MVIIYRQVAVDRNFEPTLINTIVSWSEKSRNSIEGLMTLLFLSYMKSSFAVNQIVSRFNYISGT